MVAGRLFNQSDDEFPAEVWLSLHTAAPGWLASTAAEVTTSAYGLARLDVTGRFTDLNPDDGTQLLDWLVEIGVASADAGLVSHLGFHTDALGGLMFACAELAEAEWLLAGGSFVRPPGTIVLDWRDVEAA